MRAGRERGESVHVRLILLLTIQGALATLPAIRGYELYGTFAD
jgi:hypothetical protein